MSQGRVPNWRLPRQKISHTFRRRQAGHNCAKLGCQRHQFYSCTARAELGNQGECEINAGHAAAAGVKLRAVHGNSVVDCLDRSGRMVLDRPRSATSKGMTSEQNIEGALPLDDVPLKRGHHWFAFIDRQADVTGDQIITALLDLRLELLASRDFVRTFNADFQAHTSFPLPRLAASRARFGKQCTAGN